MKQKIEMQTKKIRPQRGPPRRRKGLISHILAPLEARLIRKPSPPLFALACRVVCPPRRDARPNRKHKGARSGIARPRRRIDWLVSHDSPHAAAAGTGTGGGGRGFVRVRVGSARPVAVVGPPCAVHMPPSGARSAAGQWEAVDRAQGPTMRRGAGLSIALHTSHWVSRPISAGAGDAKDAPRLTSHAGCLFGVMLNRDSIGSSLYTRAYASR